MNLSLRTYEALLRSFMDRIGTDIGYATPAYHQASQQKPLEGRSPHAHRLQLVVLNLDAIEVLCHGFWKPRPEVTLNFSRLFVPDLLNSSL